MKPSARILNTADPCIVAMQEMLKEAPSDTVSLSQGIVFWTPPEKALQRATAAVHVSHTSAYCADAGLSMLRQALQNKISTENGLSKSNVMVTQGANQAFVNIVLALCDSNDSVVLFPPYYFNHRMALQMSISPENIILGQRDLSMVPDPNWLEKYLSNSNNIIPKMIVITNPDNPTGTVASKSILEKFASVCKKYNIWMVLDNTYEYFIYDEEAKPFHCIEDNHILNIFSFSKAYGMMGWRMGYIAYIDQQNMESEEKEENSSTCWSLESQLLKCQDTIPICPTIISQHVALGALEDAGKSWVQFKLADVLENQNMIRSVLNECVGEKNVWGGDGAIYFFVKLPTLADCNSSMDDEVVVRRLALDFGVVLIPGSACGASGHVRVSYANLEPKKCKIAAEKLRVGLKAVIKQLCGGGSNTGKDL